MLPKELTKLVKKYVPSKTGYIIRWDERDQFTYKGITKDTEDTGTEIHYKIYELSRYYYNNQVIKYEYSYDSNRMQVYSISRHYSGNLASKRTRDKDISFYDNGIQSHEINYKDDKKDGIYKSWLKDGSLHRERLYNKDRIMSELVIYKGDGIQDYYDDDLVD